MADDSDLIAQIEQDKTAVKSTAGASQVRKTVADVYTFVRSREVNKTISGFTFDHYIDEAKRKIKNPSILYTASGQSAGTRPSQLDSITKLEQEFGKALAEATKLADAVGKDNP